MFRLFVTAFGDQWDHTSKMKRALSHTTIHKPLYVLRLGTSISCTCETSTFLCSSMEAFPKPLFPNSDSSACLAGPVSDAISTARRRRSSSVVPEYVC